MADSLLAAIMRQSPVLSRLMGVNDALKQAGEPQPAGMMTNPSEDIRPHLPPWRLPQRGDINLPAEGKKTQPDNVELFRQMMRAKK